MTQLTIRAEYGLQAVNGEVGIEIEMEGKNLPDAPNGWHNTKEGSIKGKEYVLTGACERAKVKENLDALHKWFKKNEAELKPGDGCGIHLHINVQTFTFKQVLCYACLYLLLEDALVHWCGDDRVGNLFCLRSQDADYLLECLAYAAQQGSARGAFRPDQCRYASMNFDALGKYGSLEFRAMRTPAAFVKPTCIWAETLLLLKDKSLRYKEPSEIIENLSADGLEGFAWGILDHLYDEYKYPGLIAGLKEGMRRVQDVAYASRIIKTPITLNNPFIIKKRPVNREANVRGPINVNWDHLARDLIAADAAPMRVVDDWADAQ